MILDIYKDSFEFAGKDFATLLKLGLLSLFSFLIIPEFLVMGYQYRVIGAGINGMVDGEDKLPEFNNFKTMFIDGIKLFVVQLIYCIVPIIIFFIFTYLGSVTNIVALNAIGVVIGVILFIIAIFYSFLAIPNMVANEGSIKAAFDFERINEIIKMIGIGKYLGFVIGLYLITSVITMVVLFILVVVFALFGIATFSIDPFAAGAVVLAGYIVYIAVFSFIVTPYLIIFTGRANGLLYGVGA